MTTLDDNPDDNTGWQPPDDNPQMTTTQMTTVISDDNPQMTTPDDNSHLRWQHQMTTTDGNTKWQQLPATHLTSDNGDNDRDDNLDDNTQMTT
jgi:hypothetical protein